MEQINYLEFDVRAIDQFYFIGLSIYCKAT